MYVTMNKEIYSIVATVSSNTNAMPHTNANIAIYGQMATRLHNHSLEFTAYETYSFAKTQPIRHCYVQSIICSFNTSAIYKADTAVYD